MKRNRLAWFLSTALALAPGTAALAADEEAAEASSAPEVNLSQLLSEASGVRVATMCTNCNIANVTMLGQTGDHVQIWQDGLPVVGGLGGIYLLSVLPSDGIASTEVIRGAGTVLSGSEASVGAVVLRTLDPSALKAPRFLASLDVGSLDWRGERFMAFGQEGRFGGGFTFTHSESDPSDPNGDGNFDLGASDRTTFAGTGTYEFTKRSRLRLNLLSYDEAQRDNKGGYAGEDYEPTFWREDIDLSRNEGSLDWDLVFPDGSKLTVTGRRSEREQVTSNDEPGLVQPYMTVEETSYAGEARYERTLFDRHLLTVGLARRHLVVNGVTADFYRDDTVDHKAAFAQIELALPARFDVTAGLRWDGYNWRGEDDLPDFPGLEPTTGRSAVLPRVRIAWKATKTLALSFSGGKALAPPKPIFERVCCGQVPLPNDFVRAETSRNYLLDADWVPWRWLKLRGSLFRNYYSDYHQKLSLLAFNYIPTIGLTNYSPFTLEGAELSFEMRFFDFLSFGAQATNLRKAGDEPIEVGILNDTLFELPGDRMIPFVPEKQSAFFVKWDDTDFGLQVSLQAQYTGGMFVQELPEGFGICDVFKETPSFWVVNFRAEKKLGDSFAIFAGVDNMSDYHQTNLDDPRYDYQWGPLRGRYYYGGLSWKL